MYFEVKARMIVREPEAKGILSRLLDPFAQCLGWLAFAVQKHPFVAVAIVLIILLLMFWRLRK